MTPTGIDPILNGLADTPATITPILTPPPPTVPLVVPGERSAQMVDDAQSALLANGPSEPAAGGPIATLFGLQIDAIDLRAAVDRLMQWVMAPGDRCRYVVTPNVDHLVMLRGHERFQDAYRNASLVVADGLPLVLASRLLGQPIPERVAGSDLVPALLAAAGESRPLNVYLLGAAPGVADRAAVRIQDRYRHVRVTGTYSPPLGFEHDDRENRAILERIAAVSVDVVIVGLGAPKQELWVHAHHRQLSASVAICAGATIDFLAGEKRRAPRWMQRTGLEWFHRMLTDPRRLVRRYARDAWVFPQLVWQEWK